MYSTILLCYDGSAEGRMALDEGARLAQATGAGICLLAVVETSSGSLFGQVADAHALELQRDDIRDILEQGRKTLAPLVPSVEARLEFGDPVATITRIAAETGAGLVVVGHHQQGALTRWLTRSVAMGLADTLECSLLLAGHTAAG